MARNKSVRARLDYEYFLFRLVRRAWRERKPRGFHVAIFSSRFIYGLARRTKRKWDYSWSRARFRPLRHKHQKQPGELDCK